MRLLWENIFHKNPVFILLLGLVPAVAVTSTAYKGLRLGLITAVVLVIATLLNFLLTLLLPKNAHPMGRVGIVIILTILVHTFLLRAYPGVVAELGIFLPLLVANSLVIYTLDQDLSFGASLLDAVGKSLGFVVALIVIGVVREFLGLGSIFAKQVIQAGLPPLALAGTVPGGMIIVGFLVALANKLTGEGEKQHD